VRRALGFWGPGLPGITTRPDVCKRLAVDADAAELPAWAAQALEPGEPVVWDGQARHPCGIHGEE
jgi:hypothetical protein